ncbi:unnamed protein product [Ambrosiozyma monospora]|uniref:Unnamed protein product n=1 Tax=Ambrosiozyma monospora TaxID=43982 RepID=A0ACB5T7K2_AMBMO|nr:unnamed protein product [Ambrosiozyma monospora]
MSLKFDESKRLFLLRHLYHPVHNHTAAEIVNMAKSNLKLHSIKDQWLPVNIPNDDKFTLSLNLTDDWSEVSAQLKKHKPDELQPDALNSIHEAYIKLIDSKETSFGFSISQFVQFMAMYSSVFSFRNTRRRSCYVECCYRLNCNARMSLKFDKDKKFVIFKYTHPPVHSHTGSEITERFKLKSREIRDHQLGKVQWSPVSIPNDDRFTLSSNLTDDWSKVLQQLKKHKPDELQPDALNSIHEAYIKLIDSKETAFGFSISQFVQFMAMYSSVFTIYNSPPRFCYVQCCRRLNCNARMSLKFDKDKKFVICKYTHPPVHGHTGSEIVESFKKKSNAGKTTNRTPVNSLNVKIPEDERFKITLPTKVNWRTLARKLMMHQIHDLQPNALTLINQTYINLYNNSATTYIFTPSQILQFLAVYMPFLKLTIRKPNFCYLSCDPMKFKCNASISLKVEPKTGLFYLGHTHAPVHNHTSDEMVKMCQAEFTKRLETLNVEQNSSEIPSSLLGESE